MRRSPIRKRSDREAKRLRKYEAARALVFERNGGSCEAMTPDCRGLMDQVHHRKGRDGDFIDNVDLLLGVCWSCHRYIHDQPSVSYTMGWLVKRNE
jgi:hypothetical protein